MARLKGVFFDMGDTLVSNPWGRELSVKMLARTLGDLLGKDAEEKVRAAMSSWDSFPGREKAVEPWDWVRIAALLRRLGLTPRPWLVDEAYSAFLESMVESWRFEEGAVETLVRLKEEGYIVGVISNTGLHEGVMRLLRKAGLYGILDVVITSQAVSAKKPDTAVFNLAAWLAGVEPGELAYVGNDPVADIRGAKSAGWRAIHKVVCGSPAPEADAWVRRISEVPKALRAIEEKR